MNRWVSYFLILSMLRLQLVFCGCGAIGHFELSGHDLNQSSSGYSSCACEHHQTPVCEGKANHHDKVIHEEWLPESFPLSCNHCVGREPNSPHHHHHSHRYQPKTRVEQRLDYLWFDSFAGYGTPVSACASLLQSGHYHGPGIASFLMLQVLVALLRI